MLNNMAIFSIKPKYVSLIFSGVKKVELRKKIPRRVQEGSQILIWETSPSKQLSGSARIKKLIEVQVDQLWDIISGSAAISREEFYEYYDGVESGVALFLEDTEEFAIKPKLQSLRELLGFNPPQSFRYVSSSELEYLENRNYI